MPIYEYRCRECGVKFEKWLRSMSSTEKVHCPRCGSHHVEKAVSLISKGGSSTSATLAGGSCAPAGG